MYEHRFEKRVRYGDTDKMGYLYYGNYAQLFEIGRAEAIRNLGTSYKAMEDEGIMMPVVEMKSRYLAPAFYDDLLTIETRLEELPTKMITFHHRILKNDGRCIHKGYVKLFFIDKEVDRRVSCPEHLVHLLKPFFPDA